MDFINCIICGQNNTSFFKKWRGWTLVKCRNDGLIYVNPQPSEEEVSTFYNSGRYFKSDDGKFGYKDYVKEKRFLNLNNEMILRKIKICAKKTGLYKENKKLKLLDIGAAHGFFVEKAIENGFDAQGVDVSKEAVDYARKNNLNIALGTTKEQNYPDNFFDIVTLIGVIEHFTNPTNELQEISRILKDEGLLVILTLDTNNFRGRGAIKPPEHLYYFSRYNLAKFLFLFGLRIFKIYRHFTFYSFEEFFFHFFARFFGRNKLARKMESIFVKVANKFGFNKFPIPIPDGQILVIAQRYLFLKANMR
jgi:2-polyprenyl-3-methyl-5-hydroxy-6-metoxy-1,4-benzoquinol methylase